MITSFDDYYKQSVQAMIAAQSGAVKAAKNPLDYAESSGLTTLSPLDPNNLAMSLQQRSQQATSISGQLGMRSGILKTSEAGALAKDLSGRADPFPQLSAIVDATRDDEEDTLSRFYENDPAIASVVSTAMDDMKAATTLFTGLNHMKANPINPADRKEFEAAEAEVLQGMFGNSPGKRNDLTSSARAYYFGVTQQTGSTSYKDSLQKFSGVVEMDNGRTKYKTIVPRFGMSQKEFSDFSSALTPTDIMDFGNGTPAYSEGIPVDFTDGDDIGNYNLVALGKGLYGLELHGSLLSTVQDLATPYTINLRKALKAYGR